jgi:plasmid maintenance system antidote protein VapI
MAQKIQQLTPAIAIHPGEMLKDELDARTMKQKRICSINRYSNNSTKRNNKR